MRLLIQKSGGAGTSTHFPFIATVSSTKQCLRTFLFEEHCLTKTSSSGNEDESWSTSLGDNLGQDVGFAKDLDFLLVDFDFRAAVLGKQHFVADSDGDW